MEEHSSTLESPCTHFSNLDWDSSNHSLTNAILVSEAFAFCIFFFLLSLSGNYFAGLEFHLEANRAAGTSSAEPCNRQPVQALVEQMLKKMDKHNCITVPLIYSLSTLQA